MKRGAVVLLIIFLVFTSYALAQQDEFSVRFHSFGKNATIDIKSYLGESELYLASPSNNIIIEIDQKNGIATLQAGPGWEGSEVVYFRTNESLMKEADATEVAKFLPVAPEILYLRKIKDEELARLFEGTIDPGILEMIREVKREEITSLSKEIRQRTMIVRVNDEVDLKMEMGYSPSFSMDFSLGKEVEEDEIAKPKETGLRVYIGRTIMAITALILIITTLYLYKKYSQIRAIQKREIGLEHAITQDIKKLNLNKLSSLQKNLERWDSSDRFIKIVREFFSSYFGIEYNFEFKHLIRRVKDSNLSWFMKNRIISFLDDFLKIVYYSSEKGTQAYGQGQIPKQDLQRLITNLRKIIRRI